MKKALRVFLIAAGLTVLLVVARLTGSKGESRYNVILISMDTTRYDHVDTGRGARARTPRLKRFAQRATVLENVYTVIPQTLPSHLSIFTGHYPHEFGVKGNEFQYDGRFETLPQILRNHGYSTGGVISLGTLNTETGFNQGFDHFVEDLFAAHRFYVPAESVTRRGLELLDRLEPRPFFLFMHYSDPHTPYAPPDAHSPFTVSLDGEEIAAFNGHQGAILRLEKRIGAGEHTLTLKVHRAQEEFSHFALRRLKLPDGAEADFRGISYSPELYGGSHRLDEPEGTVRFRQARAGTLKLFQVIPILTKEAAIRHYRAEVEYMDRHIGHFLDRVARRGLMKDTVILLFADHGEGLGERDHYFGHVRHLNPQFIHIPAILHVPRRAPARIATPMSTIGVTPTLLEILKIEHATVNPQLSWQRRIDHPERSPRLLSFAFGPSAEVDKFSVIRWPYQAIFISAPPRRLRNEFYNIGRYASFSRWDRISYGVFIDRAKRCYYNFIRDRRRGNFYFKSHQTAAVADQDHREQLKSLGYL